MEYNIEELKLYKERENAFDYQKKPYYIYDMEKNLSKEEKIEFIDTYYEKNGMGGLATYMLNLMNKYNKEKDTLMKDECGDVKFVATSEWLRENDTLNKVDQTYWYGHYFLCGREYLDFSSNAPTSLRTDNMPYANQDGKIVDQWFHDLLDVLYREEVGYYEEHDPSHQKIRQIEGYYSTYGSLGIELFGRVGGNGCDVLDKDWLKLWGHTKPTEEELDKILEAYKEIEATVQAKIKEIQERLGWELQITEDRIVEE